MADRYLSLVNSPVGSAVASRVGLPRPVVLRRYQPGDPLLPAPLLLGSTSGPVDAELRKLLEYAGADVRGPSTDDETWGALVLDARGVGAPGDLGMLRTFFAGRLRQLVPSGRVLVLGRAPDGTDVRVDATRQALDGIV